MRGWFDGFRENGGPTLYAYSNRTSVYGDLTTITVYIVFITLFLAFFVIFPGIRRERFTTFTSVTLSLFVGTVILIGNGGSSWHVAEAEIQSAYKAFSNDKIMGRMGIYIGLVHANVTLEAIPVYYNTSMDINFNERFTFGGPMELKDGYRNALIKGLPFPILTVAEYLAVDSEGFCWGRTYREAGYYTSIFLWTSFAAWCIMNILFVVVPRYGAYAMTLTGLLMLLSNAIYYWLLPSRPLLIQMEAVTLRFELGWCFWVVMIAGALCTMVGGSISIIDLMYPHKFSTVLEMDYGTPFDRHTIIEDSTETKKKKKELPKLEEPAMSVVGLGGLLRRLSKRDRDRGMDPHLHPAGHDNYAFEMDAPKSPWRYPHLMFRSDSRKSKQVSFKQGGNHLELPPGTSAFLRRTDSKDSSCSSISSVPHQDVRQSHSVPASAFHKFRRTDSSESSNSSLASFGLSILSRTNSRKQGSSQQSTSSIPFPLERNDSEMSTISRGFVAPHSSEGPSSNKTNTDEVAIVVSHRKDSVTKAVRRNSAEHQRNEASMW